MRGLKVTLIMGSLFLSGCGDTSTPEASFWAWFAEHEEMLFDFEKDRNRAFRLLGDRLHRIHPDLTFEFGPIEGGQRDFVISAAGFKDAIPAVELLHSSAPELDRWTFMAFRQRREPMDIGFEGVKVVAEDVRCRIERDGPRIGIQVFFPSLEGAKLEAYQGIMFLLLDGALGEYDVMTKAGYIETVAMPEDSEGLLTLEQLPGAFDEMYASLSN